jgi:hypothetical protein
MPRRFVGNATSPSELEAAAGEDEAGSTTTPRTQGEKRPLNDELQSRRGATYARLDPAAASAEMATSCSATRRWWEAWLDLTIWGSNHNRGGGEGSTGGEGRSRPAGEGRGSSLASGCTCSAPLEIPRSAEWSSTGHRGLAAAAHLVLAELEGPPSTVHPHG